MGAPTALGTGRHDRGRIMYGLLGSAKSGFVCAIWGVCRGRFCWASVAGAR